MSGPRGTTALLALMVAGGLPCSPAPREDAGRGTIGVAFETLQTEFWVAAIDALRDELEARDLGEGREVPETILDEGFVIHSGNRDEVRRRMWGARLAERGMDGGT